MLMAINTATSKEMVCLYQVPALESAMRQLASGLLELC